MPDERKKEAIKKGIEHIKEAIKHMHDVEALRIRGALYLELEKADKGTCAKNKLREIFEKALDNGCTEFNNEIDYIRMAVRYGELRGNGYHKHLSKIDKSEINADDYVCIELYKAKSCYLQDKNKEVIDIIEKFAEEYLKYTPFSNSVWSETVEFIKQLWEGEKDFWKIQWRTLALAVYKAAGFQEKVTPSLHLRWYWPKQRELYDLAFIAAKDNGDIEKMVEIADTQKSRPSVHARVLEEMSNEDKNNRDIKEYWDNQMFAMAGEYIPGVGRKIKEELKQKWESIKREEKHLETRKYTDIDKNWTIIHFYLNHLESKGYALLYSRENGWKIRDFLYGSCYQLINESMERLATDKIDKETLDKLNPLAGVPHATETEFLDSVKERIGGDIFEKIKDVILQHVQCNNLFDSFLTWQTNYNKSKSYNNRKKEEEFVEKHLADCLESLCREIGKTMDFLFKGNYIGNNKALFVPHDFLHRLPLHGAIDEDSNKVFLENHPCCYLPAWSFASGESNSELKEYWLLKNFPEYDYKEILDHKIWNGNIKNPASPENLTNIKTSPKLLALLCHGVADISNPFMSKLQLTNGGITYLEVLNNVKNLKGSQIVLGACETDLVPPISDVMDEHLSITAAFLTNGSKEILGTMYRVYDTYIEDILLQIINKKNICLSEELRIWQKKMLQQYYHGDKKYLFDLAAFRIYGLIK